MRKTERDREWRDRRKEKRKQREMKIDKYGKGQVFNANGDN